MKAIAEVCFILSLAASCGAFSISSRSKRLLPVTRIAPLHSTPSEITSSITDAATDQTDNHLTPVFDFTLDDVATKQKSAASFERIDDAIMGGISLSSLRDVPDKDYASWSGICRTDGGGFCGMRTLPFQTPLNATNQEGIFLDCNLASDVEAERRIWKLTVRTDSSRGEMVYQSQFDLKQAIDDAKKENAQEDDDAVWARVLVPFDKFQLVRGPRLIPDGPPLNVTGGIYQIGMTLSKFVMNVNTTELENFRPGYFDLHIKRIGFYNSPHAGVSNDSTVVSVPNTLSKEEAEKKRPVALRLLLPIAKLLFSEQANRRRSAMRILREERKFSRARAIIFGVKYRKESMGVFKSCMKTAGILSVDTLRTVFKSTLKIVLLYPLRLVGATVRMMKKAMGMKVKPSMRE